ncbi:MAG TPA: hypothetical protein DD827_07835 [Gammaproteobacteria bacterium]|nr:hypothetical protein [Gammaproteobacteria bacterium]
MKISKILAVTVALGSSVASAGELDSIEELLQPEFQNLAENLAAATVYRSLSPAEPLGTLGFDISVSASATEIDKRVFDIANGVSDWDLSVLPVPRIQVHKGLPFNFDIGAAYTGLPEVGASIIGAELKWAFVDGGIAIPAIAVRASYSKLSGIDEIEVENMGFDISISKGFAMLTPYGGIGLVMSESTPQNIPGLKAETVDETRVFAGLNINLGMNLGFEVDTVAGLTTYSAKVGIRF